jgi:thioredoxin-like negative regulator of GroEL
MPYAGKPSGDFLEEYQSFLGELRQRIPLTKTSTQYQELMEWKNGRIRQILTLAPPAGQRDAQAWYAAGHLMQLGGFIPEALYHFKECLRLDPRHSAAATSLISMQIQADDPLGAGKSLHLYRSLVPQNQFGPICLAIAGAFFEHARYSEANDFLVEALPHFPLDHQARRLARMLCQNFTLAGQKQKALDFLAKHAPADGSWQSLQRQTSLLDTRASELAAEDWLESPAPTIPGNDSRLTLIDFWAPWCPDCMESMNDLARLHDAYRDVGLRIISVSTPPDTAASDMDALRAELKSLRQTHNWQWTFGLTATGENHRRYAVSAIPHFVLIDANGLIRYVDAGNQADFSRLQTVIDHLLAER